MNEFDLDIDPYIKQERKVFSVSELNRNIRFMLEDNFSNVWVEGELSSFIHHSSGHMYFSVKDDKAVVRCAMFKGSNSRVKFKPESGMQVVVRGKVSFYAPRGDTQMIVEDMEPKGIGALQVAFDQLKKKLYQEGLFDASNKKPIPYFPNRVGIVTSLSGAVIHDIQHVLDRRFPKADLVIAPVQVQGADAKYEIQKAIQDLNEFNAVDVIILARGGGSMEDLWAFNEEIVARAIFDSKIPIISAIGHEVDYTIADFVSDERAPTPSAAAEMVYPIQLELEMTLERIQKQLKRLMQSVMEESEERLDRILQNHFLNKPQLLLEMPSERLERVQEKLAMGLERKYTQHAHRFAGLIGKLEVLSPLSSLARGYSIVFDAESNNIIKSTRALKPGQRLRTRLADGEFTSEVIQ